MLYPPVSKAVFPVAGLETRFLPATRSIPKEMLPMVEKPLIQYAIEEAIVAQPSPAEAFSDVAAVVRNILTGEMLSLLNSVREDLLAYFETVRNPGT